jgi:hypothetical protein
VIVACVWVQANVPFGAEYVTRLASMVRRHLPIEHRFICFTDRPAELAGVRTIAIPPPQPGVPGWWSKLELFNGAHGLEGEGLYLDLDVLVVGGLLPVARHPAPGGLALVPHEGTWQGRAGKLVVRRYNSSVMRLRFGEPYTARLHDEFTRLVPGRLWGDQDWIGEQMPGLMTMPLEWFPRISSVKRPPNWPAEARVVLCKKPKNHDINEPWMREVWR